MNDLTATGFRLSDGVVELLDQQLLPHEEQWVRCETLEAMIAGIRALKVRGAPAIGVAASLFVTSEASRDAGVAKLLHVTQELRTSRPTAVNLMNYMDRLDVVLREGGENWREGLFREVQQIFEEDVSLCDQIAAHGLSVLPDNPSILTHCNTGSLATAGRGTALGIITKAHEEGRGVHVWVDETRPLLQGGRLTTWELSKAEVPYTLIAGQYGWNGDGPGESRLHSCWC